MIDYKYAGQELDLFRWVKKWKAYFIHFITPHLGNTVLEVGAGKGGTTEEFFDKAFREWVCMEPDPLLFDELNQNLARIADNHFISQQCTMDDLPSNSLFESILYIDVLEHIENDAEEIRKAASHLHPGGKLIVLSPACQFLFSPFDEAVGHYRRYDKKSLQNCIPESLKCVDLKYLDSAGGILSMGNKLLLKKSIPTQKQLAFWDQYIIPISYVTDKLINYKIGKSILGVWQKQILGEELKINQDSKNV